MAGAGRPSRGRAVLPHLDSQCYCHDLRVPVDHTFRDHKSVEDKEYAEWLKAEAEKKTAE